MSIKNVAAVVSGMDEEYPYQIILGINEYARQHNINVSYFAAFGGIIESEEFDTGEFSIYNLPDFSHFDGTLLLTNTFANPRIRNKIVDKVRESGIPSVVFECKDYEDFYDVSINNYSVMKKLVEHLIEEHGAKVFNFISGPIANPEANERYRAFRDALAEHGIEFDEENRFFRGCFRSYDGIKAFEDFERSGMSLPDVFVCANDSMALTAMNRLQRMGYKIPEDVMITGFDNTFNAQNSYPVLTTVKRPLFYSGTKACEILYSLMNGESQPKSTYLEAEPVFTESCGCTDNVIDNLLEFKRNTYARIERTYTNVHMLNRLIAGLAMSENIEECTAAIEQMLDTIGCKDFSLCLVNHWNDTYNTASIEENDDYPPVMTAPFIWNDGHRSSVKMFPSSQLFPVPLATGGNISYFLPLHFNQRVLGYYIIKNDDFPITSLLCHTMTMSIGNALEGISKLNVLDPLCKIYNRKGFEKNASYIFKDAIKLKKLVTICFVDLDGLKKINDTYGHAEGDYAIKSVADAISASCGKRDICGRFGGDEFVVLGIGDSFGEKLGKKLAGRLERLNQKKDKPYEIAASIGCVSEIPEDEEEFFDMIQRADEKMYQNKKMKKRN